MVRMRWLALALVGCLATTAHAQTAQKDSGKTKPTMTKSAKHMAAPSKMAEKSAAATTTAPAAKSEAKAADTAKAPAKGSMAAKPATKHRKTKAKKDTSATGKG